MAYSGPNSVDPRVEVSHASLVSVGCRELGVYPANAYYEQHGRVDTSNNRRYMEWAFLIGPVAHRAFGEAKDQTRSWLIGEEAVRMTDPACTFVGVSEAEKALVFRNVMQEARCTFSVDHPILINPVLRIENWMGSEQLSIHLNGTRLLPGQYRSFLKNDGDVLIFLHATLREHTELSISSQ
jgi:hypothetical protein